MCSVQNQISENETNIDELKRVFVSEKCFLSFSGGYVCKCFYIFATGKQTCLQLNKNCGALIYF